MIRSWIMRRVRAIGASAAAAALFGCVVYPAFGPRYSHNARLRQYTCG